MANLYQKISELDRIETELSSNDIFIISRPTGTDSKAYNSYGCNYSHLSNDIKEKIYHVLSHDWAGCNGPQGLVNKLEDIRPNGTRIVQENVIDEIKTNIDGSLTGNYLDKSSKISQTVEGPVVFQDKVTIEDTPVSDTDAVNKKYVDDVVEDGDTPIYFSKNGVEPISSFVITQGKDEFDILSAGQIGAHKSNPVICYIEDDCLLQIQIAGTLPRATPVGVFACNINKASNEYDGARTLLLDRFKVNNLENLTLLHLEYGYDNLKSVRIINLNIKGGTWIAISKGVKADTEKKTIQYWAVYINKNKAYKDKHYKDAESYSDVSGYSYHYEQQTKNRKIKGQTVPVTKWVVVYDRNAKGKKYKLYHITSKQIYAYVFELKNAKFVKGDTITFSKVV